MNQKKVTSFKKAIFAATGCLMMAFSISCSEQSFSVAESQVKLCDASNPDKTCEKKCDADGASCRKEYDYQVDTEVSVADILFVVDNSGSMSPEQREMGTKFPSFLQSIADLDYRVAITTTDISNNVNNLPGPNNGNGALQDGRLIEFESGRSFLDGTQDIATEESLFLSTVKRDETQACENSGYNPQFCPSGDERGILAAHMSLSNNYKGFVRNEGHLAVIILSDEDERSQGNLNSHPFVSVEHSQNFVDSVKLQYPNKTLKVHSIVIQPGDSSCLSQQSQVGALRGFYGQAYSELTTLTGGINGDICSSNYANQLQDIGDQIAIPREALPCRPEGDNLGVSFIPEPPYQVDVVTDFDRLEVNFSRALPKGTKIRFQFSCAL